MFRAVSLIRLVFMHLDGRYIMLLAELFRWILGRRIVSRLVLLWLSLSVVSIATLSLSPMGYALDIDGRLDEVEWQTASHFLLDKITVPYSLATPPEATEVRVFASEEGLYVGVVAEQSRATQSSIRTPRDAMIQSDYVDVIIDFDHSQDIAYGFRLGNGGSMRDGIWQNENQFSTNWDGTWYGQTHQEDDRWVAEYLIPWTVAPMAMSHERVRVIGILVSRHNVNLGYDYSQVAANSEQLNYISEFAALEVDNFAVGSLDFFVSASHRQDLLDRGGHANLSLEVFWRPDASQQLSLAVNPDFGQVESDELVVNFSAFETFYAERRPFFTENQALFDVSGGAGLRMLHTRRMGTAGDIRAAVKYTRNGEQIDFGGIVVLEDDLASSDVDGNQFFVGRSQYRTDATQLGYMFTFMDSPEQAKKAEAHSLDFRADITDTLGLEGQLISTRVDRQRWSDDDQSGDNGGGAWLSFEQEFNQNWHHSLSLTHYDEDFNINDLGYLARADLQRITYENEYRMTDFDAASELTQRNLSVVVMRNATSHGDYLGSTLSFLAHQTYKDTQHARWWIDFHSASVDDRITRGHGSVNFDEGVNVGAFYDWGQRGEFRHHTRLYLQDSQKFGTGYSLHYHPSYHFTDNYRISYSVFFDAARERILWRGGRLNRYNYQSFTNGIDFDASIADNQELRLRFQWVSVTGDNGQVLALGSDGELRSSAIAADNFARSTTRFQIRYRYELAPLSNIYLVYSRGGFSSASLGDDSWQLFSQGWRNRTAESLVAKIRYRF